MAIIFRCAHCGVEKEYNPNQTNKISTDAKELRDKTVCAGCYAQYSKIDAEVKEFAEEKRLELEKDFFKSDDEVVKDDKIEEKELDILLDEKELTE